MVRITREGDLPINKIYRARCYKCKTEFEFRRHEAEFVFDQRDGDALKIVCPLEGCGNMVWVIA